MAEAKQVPVAVVVGVGPGLGASLARRFAQGYKVAIIARKAEYLQSLAGEIRATGGQVLEVPADIGNRAQVEAAFKSIREQLGPPEVLLYNAGSGTWGTITDITPEQYENNWRVNAYGAFVSAKAVVPDHDRARARRHPVYRCNGRGEGRTQVRLVRSGQIRVAWARAIVSARSWSQGHSCRVDQRRWSHRHPWKTLSAIQGGRHVEARRDRRDLLASGASGSQRLDVGTGSAPVQGKVLNCHVALEERSDDRQRLILRERLASLGHWTAASS